MEYPAAAQSPFTFQCPSLAATLIRTDKRLRNLSLASTIALCTFIFEPVHYALRRSIDCYF
jgi:hypothetical protein